MASQIARHVLELPVVITTASRPETIEWTKSVKTTSDFYDVEDDNVDMDELSYQNQHHGQ